MAREASTVFGPGGDKFIGRLKEVPTRGRQHAGGQDHPLAANGRSAGRDRLPRVCRRARNPARRRKARCRHDPRDVAHVGRPAATALPRPFHNPPQSRSRKSARHRVFWIRAANAASWSSYLRSLSFDRFVRATRPSVSLGKISRMPPRYCVSSRVSVASAPASAHLRRRG